MINILHCAMDMIDRLVVDDGRLVFDGVDKELDVVAPIAKPEVFGMNFLLDNIIKFSNI